MLNIINFHDYMQVVENHCRKVGAKLDDISLEVQFLNDEITLDFPEGKNKEGWEIAPRSRPLVSTLVDTFTIT